MAGEHDLGLKVAVVNRANREALALYDRLVPILAPLLGKKVAKIDGGLLETVKKMLPADADYDPALTVYRRAALDDLQWGVRAMELGSMRGVESYELNVVVGHLRNHGILSAIAFRPDLRCDYTVEEIREKRAAAKAAKRAYEAAKSECWPFGEGW
jgi:hypothetical protein